jgi:hypothetical protein
LDALGSLSPIILGSSSEFGILDHLGIFRMIGIATAVPMLDLSTFVSHHSCVLSSSSSSVADLSAMQLKYRAPYDLDLSWT